VSGASDEFKQPLLHIGYHKTGSSWLQQSVFENTAAGFLRVGVEGKGKLTHLIAGNPFENTREKTRENTEARIRKAQARDLVPVISWERLSGTPHSGGFDSKIIADRLAAAFPNARVLIVIREQVSMLVSIYKQYIRAGGAATFRQYVTRPPGPRRVPLFRFDFLEYHRLIGYYQQLFGADHVLVLQYELLRTQPETFLGRIGEFVGVPATASKFEQVNVSPSALTLSFLKRPANRFFVLDAINPAPPFAFSNSHKILKRITRKVDARVPDALKDSYERRWHRYAEQEVGTRYARSNTITANLTGLDLPAFGYPCE
jgi:hypothetical protein